MRESLLSVSKMGIWVLRQLAAGPRWRESMPELVAIDGPPAIGKSTVAEIVFSRLPNPAFLDRGHGNPVLGMWGQDGKPLFAPPTSFALELVHH